MRFEPDFTKVDASFPQYDKGRYQVKVTKATPFMKVSKDDKEIAGVRYGLQMIGKYDSKGKLDREEEGRPVESYTVWLHTEGGWQFAKPFLMAAAGFSKQEEEEANKKFFAKHGWGISGEPGEEEPEVGDGFAQIVDRVVDVNLSIETSERDGVTYKNQDFGQWSPPAK